MPRHPGIQADNRMRELEPVLRSAVNDRRDKSYDVVAASKKLRLAEEAYAAATKNLYAIQDLVGRMSEGVGGIYPWGLPTTISIAEFKGFCPSADIPEKDSVPQLTDPEKGPNEA